MPETLYACPGPSPNVRCSGKRKGKRGKCPVCGWKPPKTLLAPASPLPAWVDAYRRLRWVETPKGGGA